MTEDSELRRVLRQAARDLRRRGEEAALPYEFSDAVRVAGGDPAAVLESLLADAADDDLAPLIHLARLLRVEGLNDAIAAAALRRPATLAAKRAALRALRDSGTEVPAEVAGTLERVERFVSDPGPELLDEVVALPATWQQPALAAWLAGSAGRDVDTARAALERGLVAPVDLAGALGAQGDASAAGLLRELADGGDRNAVKAARKALHQLRQRGVDVEDVEESASAGFSFQIEVDVVGEALAHITGVDGMGARIAWILVPTSAGPSSLLEAVLDDTHGIRRADHLRTTRKEFRTHMRRLGENPAVIVAGVPAPGVAHLLLEAQRLNERTGTEVPAGFAEFHAQPAAALFAAAAPWTGDSPEPPTDENRRREVLRDAVELLRAPYFSNWAVLGDPAEEAARGVRSAETSDLLVDDEQRKQQIDEAMANVARTLDAAARERFAERLRSMVPVLTACGLEADALRATVAAEGFEQVEDLYADHPLARALIQRGVMAAYQHQREQEPPEPDAPPPASSPIIQP